MDVTLPPPSSSSLEYQFPESPKGKGQLSFIANSFEFVRKKHKQNINNPISHQTLKYTSTALY